MLPMAAVHVLHKAEACPSSQNPLDWVGGVVTPAVLARAGMTFRDSCLPWNPSIGRLRTCWRLVQLLRKSGNTNLAFQKSSPMVLRGRRLGGRGIGEGLHRGPPKEANSEPKTAEVAAGRRSAARSVALLLASPFRLDQEWASSKTHLHSGQDVNVSRAGACSCA